jgi:hypothetical protein
LVKRRQQQPLQRGRVRVHDVDGSLVCSTKRHFLGDASRRSGKQFRMALDRVKQAQVDNAGPPVLDDDGTEMVANAVMLYDNHAAQPCS